MDDYSSDPADGILGQFYNAGVPSDVHVWSIVKSDKGVRVCHFR